MEKNGIKVYRTDRDGAIAILSNGDLYKIIREQGSIIERVMFIILQIKEFMSGGI